MRTLRKLFDNNRAWSASIRASHPEFFSLLSEQQSPQYLWIGCSDSRVPANQIVGLVPGEIFVHRNVANLVVHTDLNCLSVLQYAVAVLKVKHVIVCGHYGCGGIQAVLEERRLGLADNWLRHVNDVRQTHERELSRLDPVARFDRLCELNVIEQVANVVQSTMVQDAWEQGAFLSVHGWIYALRDGLLRDLDVTLTNSAEARSFLTRYPHRPHPNPPPGTLQHD